MKKIRIRYSKTGSAKYISHLDLTRIFQRAMLRAGVDLCYSQGFNPHPYLSVALPLSVGFESLCEIIDIGVLSEYNPCTQEIKTPDGLNILEMYEPSRKFSEIKWIEVGGNLAFSDTSEDVSANIQVINDCFDRSEIIINKKSKDGVKQLNIKPLIADVKVESMSDNDRNVMISAKISAQNPTLNINDFLSAFSDKCKFESNNIKRVEIYDKHMVRFA